jgi:hypothetical protein
MIKHIIFLIGLNGLTGALAWEFITIPTVDSVPVQEDHWQPLQLPTLPDAQIWVTQLNKLNLWEKETPPAAALSTKARASLTTKIGSEFKLVGIIQQGYQSYILLLDNNNKISSFSLNSSLPNGALLRAIHGDTIEVVDKDQVKIIKLYE